MKRKRRPPARWEAKNRDKRRKEARLVAALTLPLPLSEISKEPVVLLGQLGRILLKVDVVLWVDVKTLCVAVVPNGRHNGALVAALVKSIPVDAVEEGVGLDLGGAAADVTKPAGAVDGAKLVDEVLGSGRNGRILWEDDGLLEDSVDVSMLESINKFGVWAWAWDDLLSVNLERVLVPEWRVARQELVDEDAEGPPINGCRMTHILDHLGRDILGRTAQRIRLDRTAGTVTAQPLRKTKIDQLDMAPGVEQQVLGLEIPVGDAVLLLVQVLEDKHNFGSIKLGRGLVEAPELAEVTKQFAAGDVVE